jgi:hypothetical protein
MLGPWCRWAATSSVVEGDPAITRRGNPRGHDASSSPDNAASATRCLTRESSPGSSRRRHPELAVSRRSLPIGRLQVDDAVLERLGGGREHSGDERATPGAAT